MGRFEGLTNVYQPAWNEFATTNGYWAISIVDIVNEMDRQLDQKIEKRRFFQDIQNSFQWVTGIGLKMPQFFLF